MSSRSFTAYLDVLLRDAEEIQYAHKRLRTGGVGRQWKLGALNRAVVVTAVSAWEAYVEELVKEAVDALRPPSPPMGAWPALNAAALSLVGRFNNPNPVNVRSLFRETLGVLDVSLAWSWKRVDSDRARERLGEALRLRHEIAHGVNPRPTVHNKYARELPGFFRRLGRCTDGAVRDHLTDVLGITSPWPA